MQIPVFEGPNFDVDNFLRLCVPQNRLERLPRTISWFLGYRSAPQRPPGNVLAALWIFIGVFGGLSLVEAVFQSHAIQPHKPPIIILSFGATAILIYSAIDSPLVQPRNLIFGHTFACIIGIAITKLLELSPHAEKLRWFTGAFACGCAAAFMRITKTTHPPAGATALAAATDPVIRRLGWYLLPLILLGTAVMFGWALLINNLQRRYPVYWWIQKDSRNGTLRDISEISIEAGQARRRADSYDKHSVNHDEGATDLKVIITLDDICVPQTLELSQEEKELLKAICNRIRSVSPCGH